MVFATAAFTACSTEDGDGLNGGNKPNGLRTTVGTDIGGAKNVKEVRVMAQYSSTDRSSEVITTTEFVDNGFTMELPLTVAAEKHQTITAAVLNLPPEVTMTPASFEGFLAVFMGYDLDGRKTGTFHLQQPSNIFGTMARYYYSDSDVRINGKAVDQSGNEWVYDVSFTKGWNIAYQSQEALSRDTNLLKITMTTKKIMNTAWYYYGGI